MNNSQIWAIYFASVCGIRFHPRNDHATVDKKTVVKFAAEVADLMFDEHYRRFAPLNKPEDQPWASS